LGTRLYLVRHGETLWNHAMRYQGHADIGLSEKGLEQARAIAVRLAKERIDAVYASDLKRTFETAALIAAEHGLPVTALKSLREIHFGEWEGLTRTEIAERYPEVSQRWWNNPLDTRIPSGESLRDVKTRVVAALLDIVAGHPDGNVVVVSHGGSIRVAIGHFAKMDLNEYWRLRQDNAALNIIEVFDQDRAMLLLFNDTSHLGQ